MINNRYLRGPLCMPLGTALGTLPALAPRQNQWFENVSGWYRFNMNITALGVLVVTDISDGTTTSNPLAAGLTQDITLMTLPPNGFIEACRIKTSTAFAGTTTLTATIGVAGTDTLFLSATYNLQTAPSAVNFAPTTTTGNTVGNNTTASIAVVVGLVATVNNLNLISAGQADVWLKVAILP